MSIGQSIDVDVHDTLQDAHGRGCRDLTLTASRNRRASAP
ncbi:MULTISPECIES: hypothetical protein [unclassified Bradyrhizobium]